MKPQKHIKLLFASLFIASMLFSCKKQNKEDTIVNFHLYNPVTNEGFSNVTVKIIEQKDVTPPLKLENKYEKKVIWEGVTDVNGKASYSFKTFKSDKYTYWQSVDESFMNGKKIITQPDYGSISKNSINKKTYKIVDYINYVFVIKNINCLNGSDQCRFRQKSIPCQEESWSAWSPFPVSGISSYYEGCFEYISEVVYSHQNIYEVEYEITRNNITFYLKDTLYIIGNNSVDTLKYFY
ncbi:MAG: hypothetical protein M9916_00585 [Crocinitomicaceae bacterium]|nr:hypothetical protein [Crocinitomicaceae bacterium]